jgi:hypothetical protein
LSSGQSRRLALHEVDGRKAASEAKGHVARGGTEEEQHKTLRETTSKEISGAREEASMKASHVIKLKSNE